MCDLKSTNKILQTGLYFTVLASKLCCNITGMTSVTVNFLFLSSNIPIAPAFGVHLSQPLTYLKKLPHQDLISQDI